MEAVLAASRPPSMFKPSGDVDMAGDIAEVGANANTGCPMLSAACLTADEAGVAAVPAVPAEVRGPAVPAEVGFPAVPAEDGVATVVGTCCPGVAVVLVEACSAASVEGGAAASERPAVMVQLLLLSRLSLPSSALLVSGGLTDTAAAAAAAGVVRSLLALAAVSNVALGVCETVPDVFLALLSSGGASRTVSGLL